VLIASGLTLGSGAGSADATTLTQAGWWWRVNDPALPATVPAPPTVPEGGLMVAGSIDGATAIAALHFDLEDGETAPVLTLTVADNGDQGGATAILAACLTGSAWQPESAGAWANKPFPACDQGSVTGVRSDDGATWTFALAPLVSDSMVDVTLVPGNDPTRPAGTGGSVFQLVFTAPTSASLTSASGGSGGGIEPAPFDVPDFSSSPGGDLSGGSSFDPPIGSGGDLALPPVAPASSFTPALPESEQGLTATAPVAQARNAPLETAAATVEDHRALGVTVLVLCGAALLWSAQLPVPSLRRLGGFATAAVEPTTGTAAPPTSGGLGRFARARSGSPPTL
jgi:hypothetical protein